MNKYQREKKQKHAIDLIANAFNSIFVETDKSLASKIKNIIETQIKEEITSVLIQNPIFESCRV